MTTHVQDADAGITLEVQGQTAVVSINRPHKRNALTLKLWRRLGQVFEELDTRDDVRVVILTGEGSSFCSGADISEFAEVRSNPQQVNEYELAVDGCCDAINACRKPTIAAINGFCIGGGVNVAMSCDFRYASQTALIGIPAAKLSIIYGIKGTRRLYELVGLTNAKWVLFSGKSMSAPDALTIGLVDKVVANGFDAALQFADDLETNAPLSINGAKRLLDSLVAGGTPLTDEQVNALVDEAAASKDYAEGRKAFSEKRSPSFTGK